MTAIKIFLADAAFLVRQGLKSVIADYPYMQVIGEASHSTQLRTQIPNASPDILVLDYAAPQAFTLEDVRYAAEQLPLAHILVISSGLVKDEVLKALEYGVKGFLLKECDQVEIIGAIHALAKKEKFFCGKVLDMVLERQNKPDPPTDEACKPAALTLRETEIVKLMAEGASSQEIAEKLSLSVHTIYTHRKNVMRKLGATHSGEVILYAINTALVKPTNEA